MRSKTRILIVDDHPIVRLGIRQMLAAERDLEVCGEAESADAARQLIRSTRPDLAIVDLSLAQGSGLDLVRSLHESESTLPVLVLSMHDEALFAERVIRAGARGYIMKREAITGLVGAIRQVLSGRIYVSEGMAQAILERLGHEGRATDNPLASLTDREMAVFDLIGRGLNTAAIAEQLAVSIKTIETYRSNIKTKLNLKDATDLVRFAAAWTERI
ncbi:MAG TPA: response regulator transcription factor [Vicinamibacterales bacterium]|nr:response regulator transcription factor [Vicinamibacterales bacterium]